MLAKNWRKIARIVWRSVLLILFVFPPHRALCDDGPSEIDKLASTNSPWVIRGKPGKEVALEGSVYDTNESQRIGAQVAKAIRANEVLWADLVSHLNDQRHSGVVGIGAGYPCNWTVGDVCHHIIGHSLSESFYKHFPGTKMNYHRFRLPSFAKDKEKLAEWCRNRKDKKLYELQLEACEWALNELDSPDILERDLRKSQKKEISDKIRQAIAKLKESQSAEPCTFMYDIH